MAWAPIKGYEGYYEVSDSGQVRSLDRVIKAKNGISYHKRGKIMKLTQIMSHNEPGYLVVNLRKNGNSCVCFVHQLVAESFIPNPNNLPVVNHKNGNKTKNEVSNLEWTTYKDNNLHALANGLRQPRGTKVKQIDSSGNVVDVFRSVCEASRKTGIGRGSISHCINGRCNRAGGFLWERVGKCNDYSERKYARC